MDGVLIQQMGVDLEQAGSLEAGLFVGAELAWVGAQTAGELVGEDGGRERAAPGANRWKASAQGRERNFDDDFVGVFKPKDALLDASLGRWALGVVH